MILLFTARVSIKVALPIYAAKSYGCYDFFFNFFFLPFILLVLTFTLIILFAFVIFVYARAIKNYCKG